jgi:transcriptional regulator with XRE-family HTH domain
LRVAGLQAATPAVILSEAKDLLPMNVIYLGYVERGDNVPTLNTLFRLADTFGVEAADLVRELDRPRRERAARSPKRRK